ncbi:MAG: Gfo/Idh/MocA family oxidoreductase [Gammaproteobacteria bacterium]|nr:Gfo/Idh/MocA family oxidoreductase [Gammaproteobacteria bacterium]MDE0247391.1 Gfo/Idh/MocA family oxidoreductase [Gammaproteobacteria bacterium]
MTDRPDAPGVNRRDFLAVGALPIAAATLGPPATLPKRPRGTARSSQERVRVGLIGAGANVQNVQIPGFRRVPECEILAVANRSLESSRRVADAFGIPRAYAHWGDLLEDGDIDAILIGTWPYMHRTLTLAGLESGKHVLCQGRMANTAAEAREMLDASQRNPHLVSQLVPTSTSYHLDNVIRRLISEEYAGEILSVELQRLQGGFAEIGGELGWRQSFEFSGHNTLNLGSTYESMMRWVGPGDRVMAMTKTHVSYRRGPDGQTTSVAIPDHIDVMYELANGAQVHMRFSATTGLSNGSQTWIYGTEGTIHVDRDQNIFAGRRGDADLSPVANPPEQQAYYRVEEEFINAIRGVEEVTMATFETGVRYMDFVEAVYRSAQSGEAVYLPM